MINHIKSGLLYQEGFVYRIIIENTIIILLLLFLYFLERNYLCNINQGQSLLLDLNIKKG